MRIPGIPGASEPSFRTRDQVWIALDDLVYETCTKLETLGIVLSPYACKAAIQVSRQLMLVGSPAAGVDLEQEVSLRLRQRRVLLDPQLTGEILRAYGRVVMGMQIAEVQETGS